MRLRLLCVDDDVTQLWLMQRLFRGLFEIVVASSGREALDLMASHEPFDLIVSDYSMPEMDGIVFLGETLQRQPNALRILVSASTGPELDASAAAAGYVQCVLDKACLPEGLVAVVTSELVPHRAPEQLPAAPDICCRREQRRDSV